MGHQSRRGPIRYRLRHDGGQHVRHRSIPSPVDVDDCWTWRLSKVAAESITRSVYKIQMNCLLGHVTLYLEPVPGVDVICSRLLWMSCAEDTCSVWIRQTVQFRCRNTVHLVLKPVSTTQQTAVMETLHKIRR
jgi:hypothetical protein